MDIVIGGIYRIKTWEEVKTIENPKRWNLGFFTKYGGLKIKVIATGYPDGNMRYKYKCKILEEPHKSKIKILSEASIKPLNIINLPNELFEMD